MNILSFDLEHWYSTTLMRDHVSDPTNRIRESISLVREILLKHDTKATFFVVGEIAADYPDIIQQLHQDGHEIGTHGHTHTPLSELAPDEFEWELSRSVDAIDDAINSRPTGFRAPNFSINNQTKWAFSILDKYDLRYDSSVFPVRTPMYGIWDAPTYPYYIDITDPFSAHGSPSGDELQEFPLATYHPIVRIPTAGGFYARILPTRILKQGIKNLNRRGFPATLYFHPWEFNPAVTTTELPVHKRFISFYGNSTLASKLEDLLSSFEFGTFEDVINNYNFKQDNPER